MNDIPEKKRGGRPQRNGTQEKGKPRLRDVVAALDRDILRLLLKRHNLLKRMAHGAGHIDAAEEKFLRQAWESEVARVSRDARLSRQFFTLMQEAGFLPRPEAGEDEESHTTPRIAFNLAPPKKPAKISIQAPLDSHATRAWLMLAAGSGQPLELGPCLMNDAEVDCLRAIDQLGATLNRDDGARITARAHLPAESPDKVLHMGGSAWNFYLILAHYLGRPARAKFTGNAELKLASFGAVRNLLPQFGARLVPVVPGSAGLPMRVECSGVLPERVCIPHEVPIEFAEAIALAAPFYEQPLNLGLAGHPGLGALESRTLPILAQCGTEFSINSGELQLHPASVRLPCKAAVPMEPRLCAFLLAIPLALGGECRLGGAWPDWAPTTWRLLQALGLELGRSGNTVTSRSSKPLASACLDKIEPALAAAAATHCPELALAMTAVAAGNGAPASLPPSWRQNLAHDKLHDAQGFLQACGLVWQDSGEITINGAHADTPIWTAPSPDYALAYALAACSRRVQGYGLVNPGIITELYPAFWALYNGLPEPARKKAASAEEDPPKRRRVRTEATAELPELRDED